MLPSMALVATILFGFAAAQSNSPKCGPGSPCPSDSPCCSQYGQCGVGAYCLGGCDPQFSHSLDSCVSAPLCKSQDYKFNSLDGIMSNDKYLGDASKADWVSEGQPVAYGDSILLTMAPDTVGTLLSSTHYVWYGKISATMKSSKGQGVVTAFIMMSDVKDEIDFEFIGVDLQSTQSNFYWQGALNYTNEKNLTAANTDSDTHTYTIDWTPDKLTWSVDGDELRSLNRLDTYNASDNSYHYPQTPSRVQLSLWPAGSPQNGQGTVEWSGGPISWNSPDMTNGYYSAQVFEVSVQCYDPPQGANMTGKNAYSYNTNSAGFNNSIAITNGNTKLASLYATGEDPGVDPNASASSKPSASSSGSAPVNTNAEQVPGQSGGGARQDGGNSNSNSGGSQSSTGAGGSGSSTNGQFSQGSSSNSGTTQDSNSAAYGGVEENAKTGSVFAVLVAFIGLMVM